MSTSAHSFLTSATAALIVMLAISAPHAQRVEPSFDCRKAKALDERKICNDSRLAELDQAIATAYSQTGSDFKQDANKAVRESLAARHSCGGDRICILDQQIKALDILSDLGPKVAIPPWVGSYHVDLFKQRTKRPTKTLPEHIGQCAVTKITAISTRFGEKLKPPTDETDTSGSAVTFANDGYQVSYSYIAAIADSHIGDKVLLCLVSLPKDCPADDNRGKFYSATNLMTKGSWLLPDAQHMCGGA